VGEKPSKQHFHYEVLPPSSCKIDLMERKKVYHEDALLLLKGIITTAVYLKPPQLINGHRVSKTKRKRIIFR
jgi:hypothetical protein